VLDVDVPLIAAMEGHAVGGGLALGLLADIILIARESRYGANFINMGITPGLGMTRLLECVVAPTIAHEMLYGGQLFKGSHFEGRSGFNYILPRDQVLPKAMDLAARIAEKPRLALMMLKQTLSIPKKRMALESRPVEANMHRIVFGEPDILRTIEANYNE
jgi:polyketide biosynthesis enoyl-CoA hydratase PksI